MIENFKKIVRLGIGEYGSVFAEIDWDRTRLSITGVGGVHSVAETVGVVADR